MRAVEAEDILRRQDRSGRNAFTKADLAKLFGEASSNTTDQTIRRLTKNGVLVHAAHNVYVYAHSNHLDASTLPRIALILRKGRYVYESLESALSQWGDISQIPPDRITCMTTGRSGEYITPYGTIEFTHTDRSPLEIAANIITRPDNPLPIATREFARTNLRRVGRNVDMLKEEDSHA